MRTKCLDNKICTFNILLSWLFPRKTSLLDDFLLSPPPQETQIVFITAVSDKSFNLRPGNDPRFCVIDVRINMLVFTGFGCPPGRPPDVCSDSLKLRERAECCQTYETGGILF